MRRVVSEVPAYETYVRQSASRILQEASEFFMERGNVHQALRDLARRLDDSRISYAVMGAIALGQHGMPRMTLDIDILLTPEGLGEFKARYLGRGYVPAFPGAGKTFRASETGVRIEVITTGEYPGDGLPKPVRFPHPQEASIEVSGIRVITLERLIELKLASGMTAAHRLRDLGGCAGSHPAVAFARGARRPVGRQRAPLYQKLWSQAQTPDRLQET